MNDGKTRFADDETLVYIAELERENADLRAQIAANEEAISNLERSLEETVDYARIKDSEIEAMRPVVEAAIREMGNQWLTEEFKKAIREYESKVTK